MIQVAVHGGAWKRAGTALQVLWKVLPSGLSLCSMCFQGAERQNLHNYFVIFTLHLNGNRNSQPPVCKWCYGVRNLAKLQFASEVADCVADRWSFLHYLLLHNSGRFSLKLAKPFACLNEVCLGVLKPHPATVSWLHLPTPPLPQRFNVTRIKLY